MIFKDIWLDIKAVQERDPAARSALEVLLLYQGIHALIWHRFAHWFYKHKMFFIARLISQIARFFTLIAVSYTHLYVGKKITKLLTLKEDMDFEMYWDGACSAERILEFAPKGMKGFVLGTTLLFGKDRPYGEILKDIRNLRL